MDNVQKFMCPNICPGNSGVKTNQKVADPASKSSDGHSSGPYVPGSILPPTPTAYPPNAPPPYLPQSTDSSSGDILDMSPIGPWAAGHVDWTPQAGMTGVRPVVDKYSITRYSTGEWRKNNQAMLNKISDKVKDMDKNTRKEVADAIATMDGKESQTNRMLDKRVKDLKFWKKEVEKALNAMTNELLTLEEARQKLKSASKILMLPEAISKECIELRTNRYEPDLVRDQAEQELIKELSIVGEIRRVFNNTLMKVEEQLINNKAAKAAIEQDWNDKYQALCADKKNLSLTSDSNTILYHVGVTRWTENSTSLEYWEHYCKESIKNCDEIRKKSEDLRSDLMTAIIKGSQDMKTQADRTNMALGETIDTTEKLCAKLEEKLKETLEKIAEIEKLIDYINDSLRKLSGRAKLSQTRCLSRNVDRPNIENCRDEAQFALMDEVKTIKEQIELFGNKLRETEAIRAELMKYRGDLEKDIACKRKSLNIDKDRLGRVRSHMPTPEEFAAA